MLDMLASLSDLLPFGGCLRGVWAELRLKIETTDGETLDIRYLDRRFRSTN